MRLYTICIDQRPVAVIGAGMEDALPPKPRRPGPTFSALWIKRRLRKTSIRGSGADLTTRAL
jgi:hypothetical protein